MWNVPSRYFGLFEANATGIVIATSNVFNPSNTPSASPGINLNLDNFQVPTFENPLNNNFNLDFNNTGGFNTDINFDFQLNPYEGITGGDYNFNFDGGFVIYPSKPNNNGLRRVYRK